MIACHCCGTYTRAPVIVTDRRGAGIVATWSFCSPACESQWWRETFTTT